MRALKTARGVCRSRARCGLRLLSSQQERSEKVGRNRVLVRVLPRVCTARPGSSLQSEPAVAAGSMKQGTRCDPCLRRSSGNHGAEIYTETRVRWLERKHEV